MAAYEMKVAVRPSISAKWLVIAALLISLIIDLTPRFYLGDSGLYLFTQWGRYLPEQGGWTYGLVLGWVTRVTGQLFAAPLLQILLSWAAFAFFATALTKALGLRRHMALMIVAVGCLEPLGYYWSRAFMPDSLAQSAFVFLCGVLLWRCHMVVRFLLALISGVILLSLSPAYFPAVMLALLATAGWSVWNARQEGPEAAAAVSPHPAKSWVVAAAAFLCAYLTYGAVNTQLTHARRFTINITDMQVLASALSPLGADQLNDTPLTPAERSALLPLTYENRLGSLYAPNGLVPLIRGHYASTDAAWPAMGRFVADVVIHHPLGVAGLALRQWGEYLDPARVWTYHRRGWWSGAVAYGQPNSLPDAAIQLLSQWGVKPAPGADLPAVNSPAFWYYKRLGGFWSLALGLYATFSLLVLAFVLRDRRANFLAFSSLFSLIYLAEVSLSSHDMISRYLLPVSAPMIGMMAVLAAKFGVEAKAADVYRTAASRFANGWRQAYSERRRVWREVWAHLRGRFSGAARLDKSAARQASGGFQPLATAHGVLFLLTLWWIVQQGGFWPPYWNKGLAQDGLGWVEAVAVAILAAALLAPARAKTLLAVGVACYLAAGVGLAPLLATVSLGLFAWLLGAGALRLAFGREASDAGIVSPLIVGLAFTIGLFGVLLHVPANTQALYVAIVGLPIAGGVLWRRRRIWTDLKTQGRALADAIDGLPPMAFVLAVLVIGFMARLAFFPSVNFDDNAGHLRIWSELTYRHVYAFDVTQQVWAAEPFAGDLLHAITSLLSGADARGALDLALFGLLLRQVWSLAKQLHLARGDLLLVLALVASTPMAGFLLTSLQVELFLSLLAATGVNIIVRARPKTYRRDLTALLAVVALCCATKLPGFVLGACLLTGALVKALLVGRGRKLPPSLASPWPLALFVVPFAFVALQSYAVAWVLTGNPLFPLYNGVFRSKFSTPTNFADTRWIGGSGLLRYVNAFFATSHYFEAKDFVAGFQYLFLAPVALVAIWGRARRPVAAAVCLVVVGFGAVMFSQTQYWRYIFPVMPLACVAIGALLPRAGATSAAGVTARAVAMACIGLNLFFFPGISELLNYPGQFEMLNTAPQQAYTADGKARILEETAPVAALATKLGHEHPGARVLFPPDHPLGARLLGDPVYVNWYSPDTQARFGAVHTPADLDAFLKAEHVSRVIRDLHSAPPAAGSPEELLRDYLSENWVPEDQVGTAIAYARPATRLAYRPAFDLQAALSGGGGQLDLPPDVKAKIVTPAGVTAVRDFRVLAHVNVTGAKVVRYKVAFQCSSATGSFAAQINWDSGPVYYELIPCAGGVVHFEEAMPIPDHTKSGVIYITTHDTDRALISDLKVEVN